ELSMLVVVNEVARQDLRRHAFEIMILLAIMSLVIGLAASRFLDSFGRAKSQAAEKLCALALVLSMQ
ncbi:MAG: hypothetical protein AAGB11_19425, partial [Pseudomonadota bacterium]